jgi:nucleoside-diphosphate-sugar epimerase
MKILVTGAAGFVGTPLVQHLAAQGHEVVAITRREIADIRNADWPPWLKGVDAVIHLAARVHRMNDASADPLAEFRAVNRDATIDLASAAVACGVPRFIFLSSVKAAIDDTGMDGVDETRPPAPLSPYGISKLEAETALLAMPELETIILRPPLIYGPGVKANFRLLMKLARLPLPLPFGAIDNRRSLLSIGNLIGAIDLCLAAPGVAGKVFYLSDGDPVSTPQLLRLLGARWLLPVPVWLLRGLASLLGQGDKIDRLTESLAVSNAAFCRATGWKPEPTAGELEKLVGPPYS